jgi:tRNA(Arg) A34 adenosine deaminase TadA
LFGTGAFVVALVLGLAIWGFRNVLGKQTLLPAGALVSQLAAHELPSLNHRMTTVGGVLEDECRAVIQECFKARR